ncbi:MULTISPECIES: CvpA family protein [unclassified Luteibacter]|uniref:CvpA family protein n=1 Tax=unclassified Luteibacter TaxID=2620188 RepID=UPI0008C67281|nr:MULTISPECIES: CvpA family protein [unclassified Luteibacter]SEO80299.1 membrane protein required for colicin V production [Luteibacter sp. UNC138MFCol5.1]
MNWADYVILAVLFLSVLIGLMRGLISEVLSLVIWVAAFWLAWMFGPTVATYFEGSVPLPTARMAIGYGLCFIVVLLVGAVFRFLIGRLVSGTGLGGVDRLFGSLFGLARGVLIVSAVVFMLEFTPLPAQPLWRESTMLPQFAAPAAWLGQQIPANVRDYMHPPESLKNMKMPDVALPSREELMKLRDLTVPARPTQDSKAHPAAASTAAP